MDNKTNVSEKAVQYISRGMKTGKEVCDYLKGKGYRADEVREAVEKLIEYGYIDDIAYVKSYYEYSIMKGRGLQRIERELKGRGVSYNDIEDGFQQLLDGEYPKMEEDEVDRAVGQIEKNRNTVYSSSGRELGSEGMGRKERDKIYRRLLYLGYSDAVIRQAILRVEEGLTNEPEWR